MPSQVNPSLSDEQRRVLFEKATEVPGSGELLEEARDGTYACANCGAKLFMSEAKYKSTTPGLVGWPSFAKAASNDALVLTPDNSLGMMRTEVTGILVIFLPASTTTRLATTTA